MSRLRCAIIGATGYTGGELLRLLLSHPFAVPVYATSRSRMGEFVHSLNPNLRGRTELKFVDASQVGDVDVVFLCLPHGEAASQAGAWAQRAAHVIDLSADFRLRDPALHQKVYGSPHPAPDLLADFVYGLPEVHREKLAGARLASGVGCNATAASLALLPAAKAGLLDESMPIIADVKVGSSEAGAAATDASHHPERSGAVRSYAPAGHRHAAEVNQMLEVFGVKAEAHMTVTSIEMVRGALATVHCFLKEPLQEKDLWKAFRAAVQGEPFLRIVKASVGIHRAPEPKIVAGTNYADIGFALAEGGRKATFLCAIDNLMKGAAGSAVQCLNVMNGWPESSGLEFPGLHP